MLTNYSVYDDDSDDEVRTLEKHESSNIKLFSLILESKDQKYEDNEEKTAKITITTNSNFELL